MIEKFRKLNRTVLELESGILAYGAACQAVGVFMAKDKAGYSLGLWIGIFLAVAATLHMYRSLNRAFLGPEEDAAKYMIRANLIRYAVIVLAFAAVFATKAANPLAAFLGVVGMKIGAYLQPFTHKLTNRIFHETDPEPEPVLEEFQAGEPGEGPDGDFGAEARR